MTLLRLRVVAETVGLACISTRLQARIRTHQLSTGSTAVRPLFADGRLVNQARTRTV